MRSSRPATARHIWHQLGDAAAMRRILRVWDALLAKRHLAELPDDGNPYWSLHEILRGGDDHRAKLLREPGVAYSVVSIDKWRLREFTKSLEWLRGALKDDHGLRRVAGNWVVIRKPKEHSCTSLAEATAACASISCILGRAYEELCEGR